MKREAQLKKKKKIRGRESMGEKWLFFFHKTIKISVLKQPNCLAISSTSVKERLTKLAVIGPLSALLILSLFHQVGTSLPQPYFNHLRSPWPSSWGGLGRRLAQISWTSFFFASLLTSFVNKVLAVLFLLHQTQVFSLNFFPLPYCLHFFLKWKSVPSTPNSANI